MNAAFNENLYTPGADEDEFLSQASRAAALRALALAALGGEGPDDEADYDEFARSLGLPNGKAYEIVRDQLIKQKWVMPLELVSGPILRLTSLGTERCALLKKGVEARRARERDESVVVEPKSAAAPSEGTVAAENA